MQTIGNNQVFDLLEPLRQKAMAKYRLQPDDAHDVASESVLTVRQNYASIRGSIKSYAFGVLRNKVIEFHRSRRHDSLADRSYVDPSSENGGDFVRRDMKLDFEKIVQSLSGRDRNILMWSLRLTPNETAIWLNCTARNVRHHLRRIKATLQKRFPEFKESSLDRRSRHEASS